MFTMKTKRFIATTMMVSMMAFPAMAADSNVASGSADEALAVVNEFNATVVAAYEKQDVAVDAKDFADDALVAQLDGRNDYIRASQSDYAILDNSSEFTIEKVKQVGDNVVKVLATRTIDQTLDRNVTDQFPFHSATQEGYVLKRSNEGWKIVRVVDEIYGANLVMDEFIEEFDNTVAPMSAVSANNSNQAVVDLGGIDYANLPAANFEPVEKSEPLPGEMATPSPYMYYKADACAYALKWALGRNPVYNDYSNVGGDCANFTSQCLTAGHMTNTDAWYPGSYQFINVNGQRDMLINTGRAKGFYQALPVYPRNLDTTGTVLHYTNGSTWYHAVIITADPMTTYNSIRVSGHTVDVKNGPIMPINQIRSFQVM